ncbi:MAG: TRAP transporter small permease subunit [Acetobacteraceae bacterium]|nr:TRAP transporter small permease subunit [Acetobacteraceae bacterium]
MGPLLAFSRGVDWINEKVGRVADWCVLLACAISAGNAFLRYGLSWSSNAWLEVQWYLFAAVVMLGASYTLFRNEHVRVDLVYGSLGPRGRLWVDVFGFVVFMLPAVILLTWMTWPFFMDSFARNEGSPNAGGLLRWPAKFLLPLGFFLLTLQGLSELIKRIALLRGDLRGEAEVVVEYARPEQ